MLKRRRPPRRLSCVRKISGASRYNFETKRRLRIKVKRKHQSGNRNDKDVPREPQGERGTKENKKNGKEKKRKEKGNEKKLSVYSETKKENYLYRSLRVRVKKYNIVVWFASGNESKKNDVRNSSTQRSYNLQHRCRETCDIHEQVS
jgi:hypothetical protein